MNAAALLTDRLAPRAGDRTLLVRYREQRSPEAFAEIVRRHQGMVYRACLRRVGNPHDAEDLTQAVFLALARNPHLDVTHTLAGWLNEVARNKGLEHLRGKARLARREGQAARSDCRTTPENLREEIDAALAGLDPRLRQAVVLHYLDGHKLREAAALAGCQRSTFSMRCVQGLRQLRDIIARRGVLMGQAIVSVLLAAGARAIAGAGFKTAAAAFVIGAGLTILTVNQPSGPAAPVTLDGVPWAAADMPAALKQEVLRAWRPGYQPEHVSGRVLAPTYTHWKVAGRNQRGQWLILDVVGPVDGPARITTYLFDADGTRRQ